MKNYTTNDIYNEFKRKYKEGDFRIIGNNVQQSKTVEIQNAHFIVDKPYICREPNYEYFNKEFNWYLSQSLNVNDIEGGAPKMWKACATKDGLINSNYGWMIYSFDNCNQFEHCIEKLCEDNHTREACMIYQRPSMQIEYNKDGMHDFCCTYAVQYFINNDFVDSIVYMRSCDAVFGFCNDSLWQIEVLDTLCHKLTEKLKRPMTPGKLFWNAGSLHVYERHFKYLT